MKGRSLVVDFWVEAITLWWGDVWLGAIALWWRDVWLGAITLWWRDEGAIAFTHSLQL